MELFMNSRIRSRSDQIQSKKIKTKGYRPLALAIALAVSSTLPNLTQAATYTVSNTNNSGAGSLRQAVFLSNGSAGADTIEFSIASGSIINLSTEISITDSLTVSGPTEGDPKSIIINAGGLSRHFNASNFSTNSGETIILENITLTNGFIDTGSYTNPSKGGSIIVKNVDLTINHSIISESSTALGPNNGGGISAEYGNLTLNESVISGNSAHIGGGGIYAKNGNVTVNQSTVSGNSTISSSGKGGGFYIKNGNVTLNLSTVSANTTSEYGAGLYVRNGDITLSQSTLSSNTVGGALDADGGGFFVYGGNIDLIQSTISGNTAVGGEASGGGGFVKSGGIVLLDQSTVSDNRAANGAGGLAINNPSYYTLIANSIMSGNTGVNGNIHATGGFLYVNNSLFGDSLTETYNNNNAYFDPSNDPKLGPLQHNGGLTETHKPLPLITSQIINTAGARTISNDQRGTNFPRTVDSQVDMGAIEFQSVSGGIFSPPNPNELLTRRDMAREILKAIEGSTYTPPLAIGTDFNDVNVGDVNADWIEEFNARGFTEGCDTNKFCPNMVVTKEAMAKVYIKAQGVSPPYNQVTSAFEDVPTGSFAWEEMSFMFNNNWADGCDLIVDNSGIFPILYTYYCPKEPVTREWFDFLLGQLP